VADDALRWRIIRMLGFAGTISDEKVIGLIAFMRSWRR
jgi:hypothetical protein